MAEIHIIFKIILFILNEETNIVKLLGMNAYWFCRLPNPIKYPSFVDFPWIQY